MNREQLNSNQIVCVRETMWAGIRVVCAELLCTARNGSVAAENNSIVHAKERLGGSLPSVKTLLVCLRKLETAC